MRLIKLATKVYNKIQRAKYGGRGLNYFLVHQSYYNNNYCNMYICQHIRNIECTHMTDHYHLNRWTGFIWHGFMFKSMNNINKRAIGDCVLAKICHSFWPPGLVIWSLTLKNFDRYQTTYVDRFWLRLVKTYDLYVAERNINWNMENWLCRHPVTSWMTFSLRNTFVLGNSNWIFVYLWCQIKAILKITKFSKLMKFLGPTELFRHTCHRKLCIVTK